jgi:hypothetical protein
MKWVEWQEGRIRNRLLVEEALGIDAIATMTSNLTCSNS